MALNESEAVQQAGSPPKTTAGHRPLEGRRPYNLVVVSPEGGVGALAVAVAGMWRALFRRDVLAL